MNEIDKTPWAPVPILMYHDVENARRERKYKHFYVLAKDFEWQMRSLKSAGYTPITFAELGAAMAGEAALPAKPIILTFDDGYKNVFRLAHPILSRLRMPYTVFVVTGKIGTVNDWVVPEGYETSMLMDWDEILQLKASGLADIQPHTVTHPRLSSLGDDDLRRELSQSKDDAEEKLQTATTTVCYPYGDHDDRVINMAADIGYKYGVTTNFGRVRPGDHPLALPRVSVHFVPTLSFDYGIASMNYWWKVKSRVDRRDLITKT